jgi:hypothetical protein
LRTRGCTRVCPLRGSPACASSEASESPAPLTSPRSASVHSGFWVAWIWVPDSDLYTLVLNSAVAWRSLHYLESCGCSANCLLVQLDCGCRIQGCLASGPWAAFASSSSCPSSILLQQPHHCWSPPCTKACMVQLIELPCKVCSDSQVGVGRPAVVGSVARRACGSLRRRCPGNQARAALLAQQCCSLEITGVCLHP